MSEHQYINTINKILTGNEQEIETAESVFSEHKKNDLNEFLLELSNVIMGKFRFIQFYQHVSI